MSAADQIISAAFQIAGRRLVLQAQKGRGVQSLEILGLPDADPQSARARWLLGQIQSFLAVGSWGADCLLAAAQKSKTFNSHAALFRAVSKLEGRW